MALQKPHDDGGMVKQREVHRHGQRATRHGHAAILTENDADMSRAQQRADNVLYTVSAHSTY